MISEKELGDAFESALGAGLCPSSFPQFTRVKRELHCVQGRPDYVAIAEQQAGQASVVARHRDTARVLAFLKPNAVRTETYLAWKSQLSKAAVHRVLGVLSAFTLAEEASPGRWRLGAGASILNVGEIWAFELKIRDWRRALFQARQYRAFADRTLVVLPVTQTRSVERWFARFEASGVGIIAIDPEDGKMKVLLRPRKVRPISRMHRIVAVARLLEDGDEFISGEHAVGIRRKLDTPINA